MEFPFLIPIFGIVFGSLLSGFVVWKIVDLIKTWITRNNGSYDDETIDRIAKAFIKHKKDTEKRLQNIEAIITGDDSAVISGRSTNRELNKSRSRNKIEIESKDAEQNHQDAGSGNLQNILHKNKTK